MLVQQFHSFYARACTNIVYSENAHATPYSLLFSSDGFNAIRKTELYEFMP